MTCEVWCDQDEEDWYQLSDSVHWLTYRHWEEYPGNRFRIFGKISSQRWCLGRSRANRSLVPGCGNGHCGTCGWRVMVFSLNFYN